MALVKIKKGDKRHTVPYGAYLKQYAPQGWELNGKVKATQPVAPRNVKNETNGEDDEWNDEEPSKSLEEMSITELKQLAEEKGIDTKSLKTVGALRNAIKNA